MAERLLLQAHKVSDLCIGKPALRWLPPASTLADAIADLLETDDDAAAVAVWDGSEGSDVAGRLCMAGALLFLCADAAALQPVRRIDPDASVLEAVDALLGGAHTLAVPIRERWRAAAERGKLCWLTAEDVVRFLLSHVGVFSARASRSVSDLGVVRPAAAALAVVAEDSALSATVPLLRTALASHASASSSSSSSASSSSSLSSSDEDEEEDIADDATDGRKNKLVIASSSSSPVTTQRDSSLLLGWRRPRRGRTEEATVCHRGSWLVAVMVHRATHVWVVEEQELVGVVGLLSVLRVLRNHLLNGPGGSEVHSAL